MKDLDAISSGGSRLIRTRPSFSKFEFSSSASARPIDNITSAEAASTHTFAETRPLPIGIDPRDEDDGDVNVTAYWSTSGVPIHEMIIPVMLIVASVLEHEAAIPLLKKWDTKLAPTLNVRVARRTS